MGDLIVEEYCKKFMEYVKYCPDDIPIEEQKMQRFEVGLNDDIQVHVVSDRGVYYIRIKERNLRQAV